MARITFAWMLSLAAADSYLYSGTVNFTEITSPQGGEVSYLFNLDGSRKGSLELTLTKLSDTSDPAMYMSVMQPPTTSNHMWESATWGPGLIAVDYDRVLYNTNYYVLVVCSAPCSYAILYTMAFYVAESIPRLARTVKLEKKLYHRSNLYAIRTFTIIPFDPSAQLSVEANVESSNNYQYRKNLSPRRIWPFGFQCQDDSQWGDPSYSLTVKGDRNFTFLVSVTVQNQAFRLLPSIPVGGLVGAGELSYYQLNATAAAEAIIVKVTTFAGGCSLFLKKGSQPTLNDFDKKALLNETDTLVLRGEMKKDSRRMAPGVYYIGVYGNVSTAFTIYASMNFSSWLPIYPGMPQSDSVLPNASRNYYLDVPPGVDRSITIRARSTEGRTNLYVQLCTRPDWVKCEFSMDIFASPRNYRTLYYSLHSGDDGFVHIQHRSTFCAESCVYIIAVTGKDLGASRFVLSATFDEQDEYNLMHSMPVKISKSQAGYSYFRYTAVEANVSAIVFQLTSTLSDPDLFISRNASRPSASNYERSSLQTDSVFGSVSYIGVYNTSLLGEYHIAVYSSAQAAFSLVVYEQVPGRSAAIFLYPGEPQMATVHIGKEADYRFFKFEAHALLGETITVSLAPVIGSCRLYVASSTQGLDLARGKFIPNWGTTDANHSDTEATINIRPKDRLYKANGAYFVMVQGKEFAADGTASFIISYRSSSDILSLQESIPHTDEVAAGQYKYYTFPVYYAHGDVKIQLTAITGDPDLYVLVNESGLPTKTLYHFSAVAPVAGNTVSIVWEEIKQYCPEQPKDVGVGGKGNCYIRIGVYGCSASLYTIAITSHKHMPSMLSLSSPASSQLSKALYDYYYTLVSTSASLTVRLQRIYGDLELSLNLADYKERPGSVSDWRRPNKTAADYKSQSALFSNSISVGKDELSSKCSSGICIALAGVYCASELCKYTLTTSQDQVPLVIEGLPTYGQVHSGLYVHYKFFNHQDSALLLLTLMPLNNGDLDLFVSRGADKRPTEDNCDWSSQSRRSEILTISPSDRLFSSTSSMRGYYTIGVRGYHNVTFSLTVTTSTESITQIVAGAPVKSKVEQWKAKFFSYFNYRQTDVDIVLTPLEGAATLSVNSFYIGSADLYDNLPNRYNATWSSAVSGYQNRLTIPTSSPSYCTNCMLLIGVFADHHSCAFSLSVASEEESLLLQNGIPVQGQVKAQGWRYYTFHLNTRSDLDICATSYAGEANLFASFGPAVSPSTAFWKQTANRYAKHLHIRTSDARYSLGQYTIGVNGVKNTSYTITVHTRDSHITLVDGWPQVYNLVYSGKDQLTFEYYLANDLGKDQLACKVQALSDGFWPSVYVESFSSSNTPTENSGPQYQAVQHYSEEDYDRIYQRLSFKLAVSQTISKYLISISGKSTSGMSSSEAGSFEIACFGQGNSTVLLQGREEYGSLSSAAARQRFEIFVTEPGLLEVFAEPCAGHISMTISSNYTAEEDSGATTVTSVTDGRLQATVMGAWGQYFVTLKLLNVTEKATFQVSYQYYGQFTTRPKKVVAGNDGLLSWKIVGAGTVQLEWTAPELTDGTAIEQALYIVYITNTTQVKMSTVCGMRAGEDHSLAWQSGAVTFINTTTSQVRVTAGQTQYVNVVAMALAPDGSTQFLPYTPTEVLVRPSQPKESVIWVNFIVAFVLAAAFGGLYFMWKKYWKVKKKLENELQDVRKIASLSVDRSISEAEKGHNRSSVYQSLEIIPSR